MRVAVTSQGKDLTSPVDPRFGRARFFVVVDLDTGAFQVKDNAVGLNAAQGAGIQAAETVSRCDVAAVLTGHCGPKAFRALTAAGIRIYTGASGTVGEAVDQFRAGQLKAAEKADVEGHWM